MTMLLTFALVTVLVVSFLSIALLAGLHSARRRDAALVQTVLARLDANENALDRLERTLRADLGGAVRDTRETLVQRIDGFAQGSRVELLGRFDKLREELREHLAQVALRIERLSETNRESIDKLRDENGQKLEQMRQTVDEKLQGTLEKRLGESFKQVSDRLEQVHKGLGEMQTVASSVGDLRKALTNVKMRGGWGEVQLERILEEFLARGQYEKNVRIDPEANEHVEFAIKMPRADGPELWLPIDSKFPIEDYQRLVEASEDHDLEAIALASKQLENAVRRSAKEIAEKYIRPPHSLDFGVMFLPTEGLYAEVVRRPGLVDAVLQDHRVMIAGPTNLYALLTTVQATHRSVVLQKRSAEVWQLLAAVKTEFRSYGQVLAHVKKKLQEASNTVDKVEIRKRVMERALRAVESASPSEAAALLGAADEEIMEEADDLAVATGAS
ncbi:MAG: DNA recombination protein RmuC [Deltaproteobacteria bacterium]|nr:DNA recombination protein RmuC [Deltaproteobacteria bacterium]